MGGHLVEEEDGPASRPLRDEIGVGENETEEQSLLLPRRAESGGLVLAEVGDGEIAAVGAGEGPAGGGVAGPAGGEFTGEVISAPAFEREAGAGEGSFRRGGEAPAERRHGRDARFRQGDAVLRHPRFERAQPVAIGALFGEQFVAGAHRRFVARGMDGMARGKGEHEPVEEAPAARSG